MKQIFSVVVMMISIGAMAQKPSETKSWSFELGVGTHALADEYVDHQSNSLHFDGVIRKMLNNRFGLGLYGGFDRIDTYNVKDGSVGRVDYGRLHLEGVISVFDALELKHGKFNMLVHGGFGATKMDDNYFPSLSGGLTALKNLGKRWAIKADISTTAQFNQRYGFDGRQRLTNVGINSFVTNFTGGLVYYFGKKEKKQLDFSNDEPNVVYIDRTVTNSPVVVQNVTKVVKMEKGLFENVYFENDKYEILIQALNAIEKAAHYQTSTKGSKVYVRASASPTYNSTTKEYDLTLSENRANAVVGKLLSIGVKMDDIVVEFIGRDTSRETVHEFARRVRIEVK